MKYVKKLHFSTIVLQCGRANKGTKDLCEFIGKDPRLSSFIINMGTWCLGGKLIACSISSEEKYSIKAFYDDLL